MSPLGSSAWRTAVLGAMLAANASPLARGDERPAETFYMQLGQRSGPENLVYGFFDPQSGRRVARLQVAKVRLDYGKHGVFRVAWKARPLLTGVELRIDDAEAWPGVVEQLAEAFRKMGGVGGIVIRDLVIVRPGDAPRIAAAEAELTTARQLVLPRATVGRGEHHRVTLSLSGLRSGQFEFQDLQIPTSLRSGAAP